MSVEGDLQNLLVQVEVPCVKAKAEIYCSGAVQTDPKQFMNSILHA